MHRFDGTAARQLPLTDDAHGPLTARPVQPRTSASLRVIRRDLFAELTRRRRRAQIAARHALDRS